MSGETGLHTSHETQTMRNLEYPAYRQMRKLSANLPTESRDANLGNLGRKPNLLVTSLFA